MHSSFHLIYGNLVRKYKKVMIRLQKEDEDKLKIRVFFPNWGLNHYLRVYPWVLRLLHHCTVLHVDNWCVLVWCVTFWTDSFYCSCSRYTLQRTSRVFWTTYLTVNVQFVLFTHVYWIDGFTVKSNSSHSTYYFHWTGGVFWTNYLIA